MAELRPFELSHFRQFFAFLGMEFVLSTTLIVFNECFSNFVDILWTYRKYA